MRNAGLEKVFDILGEILAFVAVVTFAFYYLNLAFGWIDNPTVVMVIDVIKNYAGLALMIVVGLEATIKRTFIIRLIFYILIAIIIICQFFPGTWENLLSYIPA